MSRKTLILREDQFNEICGTNTAYLDNPGDYAEDGLTTTKTGGAVSDSNGEKEYSDPLTTDDYAHELAPETLFALLFRNGGHGLWGHWGSGLRTNVAEGKDTCLGPRDLSSEEYYADLEERIHKIAKSVFERMIREGYTDKGDVRDAIESVITELVTNGELPDNFEESVELVWDNAGGLIEYWYGADRLMENTKPKFGSRKKKLEESNGELENRTWSLDLDNDGLKKTYSYTNLTTKKTDLKKLLAQLVQQNAPKQQIQRVKSALAGVCRVLDRETGAIKQMKTNRKNLGFANQFQKEGGTKNSGNGKAHSKKVKDPNVGTGYITYA